MISIMRGVSGEMIMSEPGAILVKPSGTYFARHWRGELSLPQSFWVNGVMIGFGWMVAFQPLVDFFVIAPWWFFVAWIADYATIVWQLVGLWRSARNYRGPRVWSISARIFSILAVLIGVLYPLGLLVKHHII